MRLLVNGDSHTAGTDAVNGYAFAMDDRKYFNMGRAPHPDNLKASWGLKLAKMLQAAPLILAESGSSNDRILRTTMEYLDMSNSQEDTLMIIQWSTWEREEWLIDDEWHQINASGTDYVPEGHREKYMEWVANIDHVKCELKWHKRLWLLHETLSDRNIKHIFFNGNNKFDHVPPNERKDWGTSYIRPYDSSYDDYLRENGHKTTHRKGYHFDERSHGAWARHMMRHILDNKII